MGGVIHQVLPVKSSPQRQKDLPIFERGRYRIQILPVIEQRRIHELPVLKFFRGLGTGEHFENARAAEGANVHINDSRVGSREIRNQVGGIRTSARPKQINARDGRARKPRSRAMRAATAENENAPNG